MANRRAIDSNIWDDEWFGMLSDRAQLLWIGLFSRMADDQGRIIDNPVLIGRKVFPYKEVPSKDIDGYLNELLGHIVRYEVNGKKYIQIVKWWENQPMQYATPSCYPAPDGWKDRYRTNYKRSYIVYNWEGQNNTPAGENLYNKLTSLGRVSSWTDHVEALNFNPTPNHNPTPNPKKEEEEEPQPAPLSGNDDPTCERVYRAVTSQITFPSKNRDDTIGAIRAILAVNANDVNKAIAYLQPYYCEWKNRHYSASNTGWLSDWAVSGEIPQKQENNPNGGTKPKRILTGANGEKIEVDA